jgi:hypothetical protein
MAVVGSMFAAMWITETVKFIVNGIFLGGLSLYRASCHQHHRHPAAAVALHHPGACAQRAAPVAPGHVKEDSSQQPTRSAGPVHMPRWLSRVAPVPGPAQRA